MEGHREIIMDEDEQLQKKIAEGSRQVDASFWNSTIVIEFPDTDYSPNRYTPDSDLHELEVLAYAYENNDPFARAGLSEEDVLRVWGWIVRQRTGRYPDTLALVDRKAKRLRRRELGPLAGIIDCSVTPGSSPWLSPSRVVNVETAALHRQSDNLERNEQTVNFAPENDELGQVDGRAAHDGMERAATGEYGNHDRADEHDPAAGQGETTERQGSEAGADSLSEGLKETAQHLQKAAESLKGIAANVQIIAAIKQKDLRKWLKQKKSKSN
jgi:hypothetical protein